MSYGWNVCHHCQKTKPAERECPCQLMSDGSHEIRLDVPPASNGAHLVEFRSTAPPWLGTDRSMLEAVRADLDEEIARLQSIRNAVDTQLRRGGK